MYTSDRPQIPKEESLLNKVLAKYLPYWPYLCCSIIIGVTVGWLFLKFSTPTYEATATLIIKDEKKGSEESKLMESLNLIASKKIVENEIEIIQSRKLLREVAARMGLYTTVLEKEAYKLRVCYNNPPVKITVKDPDSLVSSKKNISITLLKNENRILLDKTAYPLNQFVSTPYGGLKFELNEHYRPDEKGSAFFLSVQSPGDLIPVLEKNLKAEPAGKLSSIVKLSYRDVDARRAEDILNQLIVSYRQSEIDEKNTLAKNALSFVNERLSIVTSELDSIQHQIQQYKSSKGAVDISTQGQLYLQNVSQNDQKLSEINTQISILNQVENLVKEDNNHTSPAPSILGISDPLLSQLLEKLNSLELSYEKGKATIGENNPIQLEIRDQINKIKPDVLRNIHSQQENLLAMRDNIRSTNNSYNSILRSVPEKEKELIDISRSEMNKRSIYSFLLQKKEESEIAYAATVADNKVIDYAATEKNPVSPKPLFIYASATIFFLGLVLLMINLKELLNRKLTYRSEIGASTVVPVIGEISYQKLKSPVVIERGKRSFIAEQFRKLRLSLSHFGIDATPPKKILVTSNISGEGKSFTAANLAVSYTLMGKKVALLDMDLNNPMQNNIFQATKPSAGVTGFLQGKESLEHVIQKTGYENLYLVPAGELPENPSELLSSGKTKELIRQLESSFDVVIIDTSPMCLVTDGYMITDLCDVTLFVVRHLYTPKILLTRLDESIRINPIHNPVIVFNGVKQRSALASAYGYGYGYDYVYGKSRIYG